ncbi:MAG: hypothetical protein PHQ66_00735 [Candidatus Nanoarchaeia archaeon]|nr:hypothetical protein [Candidatus Nanoarchaeia archaeon]MDD5358496.1 hypothetical protein [Candidatus Nanoarchaeia archaeon]MDD5589010.1 hypothetical protein [Candidatus Nanoarchaeia archaeon]
MLKRLDKKGQELSTNTIILLILGLIILVVLILGFSTGWSFFKGIISPTNVDSIVEECASTCGLSQKFAFCSAERTLRVNEEDFTVKTSCAVMANSPELTTYGVQKCSAINCDLACESILVDDTNAVVASTGAAVKYDVSTLANNLESGQICIIPQA